MNFTYNDLFDEMYFNKEGNLYCDSFIRFERLQEDFDSICASLNLPRVSLPRTKTACRKIYSYRDLYDAESAEHVQELFSKQIAAFNYTF